MSDPITPELTARDARDRIFTSMQTALDGHEDIQHALLWEAIEILDALSERAGQGEEPRNSHGHTFDEAFRFRLHDIIWAIETEGSLNGNLEWEDAQKIGDVIFAALKKSTRMALEEANRR